MAYIPYGAQQPGALEIATESSFGTPGTFAGLPTIGQPGGLESLHARMAQDESIRASMNRLKPIVAGASALTYYPAPDGATVTTRHYQTSYGLAINSKANVAAIADLGSYKALTACLGGSHQMDAFSEVSTGATVQVLTVATGADFDAGGMLTVLAGGVYQSGWVESKSTNSLTLSLDLDDAPVGGATAYGSMIAYLKGVRSNTYALRWTGALVGSTTPMRVTLVGCQPASFKLAFPAGEPATVEITWSVAGLLWDDAYAGGPVDYSTDAAPELMFERRVRWSSDGTHDGGVDLVAATVEIDVDLGLAPIRSHDAPLIVADYVQTMADVTVSVHCPYSTSLKAAWLAGSSDGELEIEVGTRPGRRIGVRLRQLVVDSFSGPVDDGGVAYCDAVLIDVVGSSYATTVATAALKVAVG